MSSWRCPVRRVTTFLITSGLLLWLVVPASADEGTYIRGVVRSPNGQPALGVCVASGNYATDVQADGSYELAVPGDVRVWFYNCHMDEEDYPYASPWFYGNTQDYSSAPRVSVTLGGVTTVNMTVPFVSNHPPELGAVSGVVTAEDGADLPPQAVYLENESGDRYPGWVDQIGAQHGHEAGRYIVPAPPGQYRVMTMSSESQRSGYLPTYYGSHPRGYAASFEEAAPVTITGTGRTTSGIDIESPLGESRSNSDWERNLRVSVGLTEDHPGVSLLVAAGNRLDRVGLSVGQPDDASSFDLLAVPGVMPAAPATVTLSVLSDAIGTYDENTLPVWLGHTRLEACGGATETDCVSNRSLNPGGMLGPTVQIEIQIGAGRVFRVGDRPQFYDSEGSVFGADIIWLAESGITRGCNPPLNDLFCPSAAVTRGQMAAFLVRALDLTDSLDDPFTDDDGTVFESHIEKLAAAGITKGCNPPVNDLFCPNDPVTRGQMAAFMVRALKLTDPGSTDFVDDDGTVFETHIEKLAAAGITKGCNPPVNDRFCPDATVTRGQMAAFLHRAAG